MIVFKSGTFIGSFFLVLLIFACDRKVDYASIVERELSSGMKNDSIFFDIHFGQSQKVFFNKCWEYNKKGILFHGPRNMNVSFKIDAPKDSLSSISMLFYPDFNYADDVRKIDVEFSFDGWAPWNQHLFSKELIPHVKDIMIEWYEGNHFIKLKSKDGKIVWAKMDNNRELLLWEDDTHYVKMRIKDKSFEKSK